MKITFLKKKKFLQNIKKIILSIIILISSSFIFYLFDFDLFNQKFMTDLETELPEFEEELDEELPQDEIKENNKIYYQVGAALVLLGIGGLCIYFFYFSGGGDSALDIANQLRETEIKYHHDSDTGELDFTRTVEPNPPWTPSPKSRQSFF